MKEKVQQVLETFKPLLALHKGDIELVDVNEVTGEVKIKFLGICSHCPLSSVTLNEGIAEELRTLVPGVRKVIAI